MIPLLIKAFSKLGAISSLFAFIPGGQIIAAAGGILSTVFSFLGWCLQWLFKDISDAFKEPQRLVVRLLCGLIVFVVGGVSGMHHQERRDATQITALTRQLKTAVTECDQWRARYADQEKRAGEAEAARKAIEEKYKPAASAPAGPAKRVRARAATATSAKAKGPSLYEGLFSNRK